MVLGRGSSPPQKHAQSHILAPFSVECLNPSWDLINGTVFQCLRPPERTEHVVEVVGIYCRCCCRCCCCRFFWWSSLSFVFRLITTGLERKCETVPRQPANHDLGNKREERYGIHHSKKETTPGGKNWWSYQVI